MLGAKKLLLASAIGSALSVAYVGATSSTSNDTTYTFTSVSLGGTDSADRIVVIAWGEREGGAAAGPIAATSITVGGSSATIAAQDVSEGANTFGNPVVAIAHITGISSSTADIVVTWDQTAGHCAIGVYRISGGSCSVNATGIGVTDGYADSVSTSINVVAGGVLIGGYGAQSNATATWTGATEDADAAVENSRYSWASLAVSSTEASRTLSVSGTTANKIVVGVAFEVT